MTHVESCGPRLSLALLCFKGIHSSCPGLSATARVRRWRQPGYHQQKTLRRENVKDSTGTTSSPGIGGFFFWAEGCQDTSKIWQKSQSQADQTESKDSAATLNVMLSCGACLYKSTLGTLLGYIGKDLTPKCGQLRQLRQLKQCGQLRQLVSQVFCDSSNIIQLLRVPHVPRTAIGFAPTPRSQSARWMMSVRMW